MPGKLTRLLTNLRDGGYGPESDPEFLHKVRTVNLSGAILQLFGAGYLIAAYSLHSWVVFFSLICVFSSSIATLVWLRHTRRVTLVAHIVMGCTYAGVFLANWYTGGLVWSNDVTFLIVPVLALFVLGTQGLVWAVLSCAGMGVFWYLHAREFPFPQVVAGESQELDSIFTWLATLFVLAGVALYYETARRKTTAKIIQAKERAEEASQVKGQFLANMSHEFRTPLNAVIGLTEVTLQSPSLQDEDLRHLEAVKASAYSVLGLVENALDITRIEAGTLELHLGPFNPRKMLEVLAVNFKARAQEKGLDFYLEFGEELPEVVRGDAARVRQVVVKMVDNAIKFTSEGGVRVLLEQYETGWLTYTFQDTGIGILPEQQGRIFNTFSQGDESPVRCYGGSGLGLAICDDLVELMGGRIEMQSMTGLGSRFEIWLPLVELVKARSVDQTSRVLAVEDDPLGRELVTTILSQAGFDVEVAATGQEALEAVSKGVFDLVLMDVQMPLMDGLTATRMIRADEAEERRMPILALTAHALEEERQRCFDAGMDDFITKPVEPAALVDIVSRWLGREPKAES